MFIFTLLGRSLRYLRPAYSLRPAFILSLLAMLLMALPVLAQTNSTQIGTLVIPSISVQAQIVHVPEAYPTWDVSGLHDHVGNLEGTGGWPGQAGNFVLAGHASLSGHQPGIFGNLASVKMGDDIDVYMQDAVYRYTVISIGVVEDTDISVVLPTAETKLTLISCDEPSYNNQAATYTRRVVVVAVLAG